MITLTSASPGITKSDHSMGRHNKVIERFISRLQFVIAKKKKKIEMQIKITKEVLMKFLKNDILISLC